MPEKSTNHMPDNYQLPAEESMRFDSKSTRQSVTFSVLEHVNDYRTNPTDEDDVQIAMAPHIQYYLTLTVRRLSFCNILMPIAFERAKSFFLLDPKFDSPVLENQYLISLNPYARMLYQFTLVYLLICTLGWALYFWIGSYVQKVWFVKVSVFIIPATIFIVALWFTTTDTYLVYRHLASIITSIILSTIGLGFLFFTGEAFSPLGHFAMCLEIVLLIYSGMQTKVWIKAFIAISFSILFETLSSIAPGNKGVYGTDPFYYNRIKILRILLQFSVHLMASHVLIMRTVRMRGTFMKMGQNLLVRRQMEMEKQVIENMIHSVMPPKFADMLLNEDGIEELEKEATYMRPRRTLQEDDDFKSLFRPFHIRTMNNVSILFADIVGFTSMSSNKSAEELVEILNDLFEKFDDLCAFNGCEKISTLGDCYYCISGCPESRSDHAICCVEMGLGMIEVMRYYEAQRHEGVTMRVGVHTGTVFFGVVGTRRVKFDVWSNDVELTDLIQSTGKPELVRISEVTLNHVGGAYLVEEGEKVMDQRTYFVMGREKRHSRKNIFRQSRRFSQALLDNKKDDTLSSSSTNIQVPPNSPSSVDQILNSLSPSPNLFIHQERFLSLKSSEIITGGIHQFCYCLDTPPEPEDAGTQNNSRRSSLLQQIYAINQAAVISRRSFSRYSTSTTTSIDLGEAEIQNRSYIFTTVPGSPTPTVANPLRESIEQLRMQSDIQLIRCIQDNAKSHESHFLKPPLHQCSLFFQSKEIEREFRSSAHRFAIENETEVPATISTPRFSTYLDIFVGFVVYCCIATSLLLMAPHSVTYVNAWLVIASLFTGSQLFAIAYFTRQMCRQKTKKKSYGNRYFTAISSWYPWHICLGILMAMPVGLVFIHYTLLDLKYLHAFEYHYGFLIFVCIVHFCNFTQLNSWMRNTLALLAAIGFILICYLQMTENINKAKFLKSINQTTLSVSHKNLFDDVEWFEEYYLEIYLDLLFLLILVWQLNRELERGYRLTFYGNAIAQHDKIRVQRMKNQADVLLLNIMPNHVAEHLKNTAKYSENHKNVAIIFASIVNFNEMCDENYLGAEEHLRVLNELIGDFDELLSRPEFKCVEKIKTIGSTFMAASGLDSFYRCINNHHIYALMEFAKSMLLEINSFNEDLMEFDLILRIGFNVGDVTAGVLGTSKLHYDIWGDAVNVASRMNTTGVSSRIQIGKDCLPYLENRYEFESRGEIYVKGKGKMEVFLYKADKPYFAEDDCWNECGLKHLLNKL